MLTYAVSVPLPGFSGLRQSTKRPSHTRSASFSPVAGIQWVETLQRAERYSGLGSA